MDVETLINDACALLAYPFKTHDISVHIDMASGLPTIWGDGAQLSQALINLLVNAQHALMEVDYPRLVKIRAVQVERKVAITVSDNGPGIPAAIRHRIFEPFFTTKAEGYGTGLGLSYCLSVVNNHDGAIAADESRASGAAITITLPIDTPPAAVYDEPPLLAEPTPHMLRVLIVDDEAGLLQTLVEHLERLGHRAYGCSTATAGLEALHHHTFDLILSDVRMPGVDGQAFYEEVRTHHARLGSRFIFITGDSLSDRARHFIATQQVPCIHKPFQVQELEHAINQVIAMGDTS